MLPDKENKNDKIVELIEECALAKEKFKISLEKLISKTKKLENYLMFEETEKIAEEKEEAY